MTEPYFWLKMDERSDTSHLENYGTSHSVTDEYKIVDSSGNDINTNTCSSPGRSSRSLSFYNNFCNVDDKWKIVANDNCDFSMSFWARKKYGESPIIEYGNGVCVGLYVNIPLPWALTLNFYFGFTSDTDFTVYYYSAKSEIFSVTTHNVDCNWHQYTLTRGGSTHSNFSIYRDGVFIGSGSGNGKIFMEGGYAITGGGMVYASSALQVGGAYISGGFPNPENIPPGRSCGFNGYINDFKLYTSELSALEILEMYKKERNTNQIMSVL